MRLILTFLFAFLLIFQANQVLARAGGGCFLPGTLVQTIEGNKPIEQLNAGDIVYSFNGEQIGVSKVIKIIKAKSNSYYSIQTGLFSVNVTGEHPFYVGNSEFAEARMLKQDDAVYMMQGQALVPTRILEIYKVHSSSFVFNLQVDNSNTFFANSIAVHNKGGGGGSSSHSSSSHRSSSSSRSSGPSPNVFYYDCGQSYVKDSKNISCCRKNSSTYVQTSYFTNSTMFSYLTNYITTLDFPYCSCSSSKCICTNSQQISGLDVPICPESFWKKIPLEAVVFVLIFGLFIKFGISSQASSRKHSKEWSSTVAINKSKVLAKAQKTTALLSLLNAMDPIWDGQQMKKVAGSVFLKLQECWQKRDYSEIQNIMMPSLLKQHEAQIESMKQRHEINKLEDLALLELEIVQVKNRNSKTKDEFTAWIKAQAKDIIIDDRTEKKIRGDTSFGVFEEFWTFQRDGNEWMLKQIDQPEEGMHVIGEENYDENATKVGLQQVYKKAGRAAKQNLNIAPQREQDEMAAPAGIGTIKERAGKVHRLLNFLAESDKIWVEGVMEGLAREYFILVNTAEEKQNTSNLIGYVTPEFLSALEKNIGLQREQGRMVQKRNLAVRNAEVVLVKNYNDRQKDEFTAWLSAQAQEVVLDVKTGRIIRGDSYVADFEVFMTFKRNGDKWLLDNVEKGQSSQDYTAQKDIDEGTSEQMMQWYYSKERTV